MSSSDSDDDCYGNVAQKLLSLKSKYVENVDSVNVSSTSKVSNVDIPKSVENSSKNDSYEPNVTLNSTDNDELTLDAIIAQNSKCKTRGKRKAPDEILEPVSGRETRSSRRKTVNSTRGKHKGNAGTPEVVTESITGPVQAPDVVQMPTPPEPRHASNSTRGRRGRGRARGRRSNTNRNFNRPAINPFYPIYSVGNTDEYPDFSDNQQLFAANTKPVDNDVEVIDEDPLEDDNEELSVKVYWQSLEIFKFTIRKYQKLTQIFEYFANKENVKYGQLLFTYNERILKIDDTPDSIGYNIAKFIDGGIVSQDVTQLLKDNKNKATEIGINIKFQCQNKKKPFETTVRPEDKLALAMMKCAEHLETPLEQLKFYFDGDLISSKSTPQDLDLESGDCIDVKIS